ncbi:MAG: hypothetical protein ABR577_00450 [Pyrinomonadaceae bacterium]
MTCVYHTRNPATVQCSRCARALCPACDHRIRGFPYCQDCIVTGVEMLQQQSSRAVATGATASRRSNSPFVAALLSIVPGLGAAYNGQTSKAIVHFTVFASFFQMATVTDGVALFILGALGTWFFAMVDAYRTAQLMRAGLAPDAEQDAITRRLYGNPFAWGAMLVVLGIVFMLHTMFGVNFPVRQFLPVALVALGAYMVFDRVQRRRAGDGRDSGTPKFDIHSRPPSVVGTAPLGVERGIERGSFRTGDLLATQVSARDARATGGGAFDPHS